MANRSPRPPATFPARTPSRWARVSTWNTCDGRRKRSRIPVIASLNGATPGGWIEYARLMEQAGADALELNLYRIATDPEHQRAEIERQAIETVREVKKAVTIPVAVKLSPFYTAFAHVARELDRAGADGLVLFNRFYQPDIDAEELAATRTLHLSDSSELRLRLHWMAILSGRVRASLAVTGGVHTGARRRQGHDGRCTRHADGLGAPDARALRISERC